ncbi:MAG: AMP-binding protein, partial [Waterburya sp.]
MNQNLLIATQDFDELSSVESTENALPIYRHFEQYAQQFPDAVAATSAGDAITYGQLNLMANQLAHYLISQQIKAQDCIGVLMEAGWEILVAIIAIHKINGIYLPLDTEFPKARIESIIEQAQPLIILCASQRYAEVESSFAPVGIKIINLPRLDLSSYGEDNPNCDCSVDSISHIFFTSGTTG